MSRNELPSRLLYFARIEITARVLERHSGVARRWGSGMTLMVSQGMTRRHFLSHVWDASGHGRSGLHVGSNTADLRRSDDRRCGKSVILLWMGGGPSTIDLWDLKPGAASGGPFRPISTSGDGQICEHLPMLARQMHHFAVIRSMSTREADHERGRCYLRTGRVPRPGLLRPAGQFRRHGHLGFDSRQPIGMCRSRSRAARQSGTDTARTIWPGCSDGPTTCGAGRPVRGSRFRRLGQSSAIFPTLKDQPASHHGSRDECAGGGSGATRIAEPIPR